VRLVVERCAEPRDFSVVPASPQMGASDRGASRKCRALGHIMLGAVHGFIQACTIRGWNNRGFCGIIRQGEPLRRCALTAKGQRGALSDSPLPYRNWTESYGFPWNAEPFARASSNPTCGSIFKHTEKLTLRIRILFALALIASRARRRVGVSWGFGRNSGCRASGDHHTPLCDSCCELSIEDESCNRLEVAS
jgi:hypothetical protein